MSLTTGPIHRTGSVHFGDASLHVWEDGIKSARAAGGLDGASQWEKQFKRDVFARIVQTLHRLGWAVNPQHYIFTHNNARFCQKGDLKGDLLISGRHIEFKMFQSVNCPTRADNEGRYESNLEACMPYVLRLEMERTRRRIRDYLCNVFDGYTFDTQHRSPYRRPLQLTALEQIQQHYTSSWHFKGEGFSDYVASNFGMPYNLRSADGVLLEHGQRVWFADHKGRLCTGIALYNINNMWWVLTGRYDYSNKACFDLYTQCPCNPRVKRNGTLRRKRLEQELSKAVSGLHFERAAMLRDVLFPTKEPLFVVWHAGHGSYHAPCFSGYTADITRAGRFTADEVKGWDKAPNKVMPVAEAKAA